MMLWVRTGLAYRETFCLRSLIQFALSLLLLIFMNSLVRLLSTSQLHVYRRYRGDFFFLTFCDRFTMKWGALLGIDVARWEGCNGHCDLFFFLFFNDSKRVFLSCNDDEKGIISSSNNN